MRSSVRPLDDHAAGRLIQADEPWLSCDDCFTLTDVCVEDLLEHHRPPSTAMAVHLAACAACHDEVVALLTLLIDDQWAADIDAQHLREDPG